MFLYFSHIAPSKIQSESKARLPGYLTNCLIYIYIYIILCISPEDPTSMCDIRSTSLPNCFWSFCLVHYCDYLSNTTFRFYIIDFQLNISLPNFAFFTAKSPSVTQRSVSQENASFSKTIGSNIFFFYSN